MILKMIWYCKLAVSGMIGKMVEWHDRFFPVSEKKVRLFWGDVWIARADYLSQCLRWGLGYEKEEQAFLLRFIQKGWTVLDVGAHHGLYTLLFAHRTGSGGRVISFEPSPREREQLQRHLELNHYPYVTVESVALGEREGTETFYVCGGIDTGRGSLRPPRVASSISKTQVKVRTLDACLAEQGLEKIDFIKMDVEGGEWGALKGAARLLEKQPRPVILTEWASYANVTWGYPCSKIRDFLEKKGYSFFSFKKGGRLKKTPYRKNYNENVLAVPLERHAEIQGFLNN